MTINFFMTRKVFKEKNLIFINKKGDKNENCKTNCKEDQELKETSE